ncbi:MAG: glycosyltransferase family 4 protein [Wenzhouxiangella sp.]
MSGSRSVGLIGNLGGTVDVFNGQTLRTRLVRDEFAKRLGMAHTNFADSALIGRAPARVLGAIIRCFRRSDVVCIMPGERGLRVLLPLFLLLRRVFRRPVHYLVVGGWLPAFLRQRPRLCAMAASLDGLHVQSQRMQRELAELGIEQVHYLPNFREFPPSVPNAEPTSSEPGTRPLKLVFLSRVIPEKGVALCVDAVAAINAGHDLAPRVTLDIYGPVAKAHQDWLEKLLADAGSVVRRYDPVPPEQVVSTLAAYDALLFPTWYSGEGFPGVIVEAYAAGIPVVASDWQDNSEVVEHGVTGCVVATGDSQALQDAILELLEAPAHLKQMKRAASERAAAFHVDQVMPELLRRLQLIEVGT